MSAEGVFGQQILQASQDPLLRIQSDPQGTGKHLRFLEGQSNQLAAQRIGIPIDHIPAINAPLLKGFHRITGRNVILG